MFVPSKVFVDCLIHLLIDLLVYIILQSSLHCVLTLDSYLLCRESFISVSCFWVHQDTKHGTFLFSKVSS